MAIYLNQALKHWNLLILLTTQKPQNCSGNDHLKENWLFCMNICLTVEVLISSQQLESNIIYSRWNFRALCIYVPDGRDFGAVNWCAFGLVEFGELTLSKGDCNSNTCQHRRYLEAEAPTEHYKGLEKRFSDYFRVDWGVIFLIRNLNRCSDRPDLLSLFLLSVQLLPRWHKPHCSIRTIPFSVLKERRPELFSPSVK